MILIVSKCKFEVSTEEVSDWIDFLGGQFYRLNGEDVYGDGKIKIEIDNNNLDNFKLSKKDEYHSYKFNIGWFRRWSDREYIEEIQKFNINNSDYSTVQQILLNDESDVRHYVFGKFTVQKWLTKPSRASANKMIILARAVEVGLQIPETIICTTRDELLNFKKRHERIITKDVSNPYHFQTESHKIASFTRELSDEDVRNVSSVFKPSLFQKLIEKEFEIRVFYLDGNFFSMAIFSQADEQTKVDFRNYNFKKPNRRVPFKVPSSIETKIESLMKILDLNTGSIDLIRNLNGEYVFLEINPVGQFGMTSYPCNYYIEREIAKYLVRNDREQQTVK